MTSFRLRFDRFLYSSSRKKGTKNFVISTITIFLSMFIATFICMAIYGKGSLFNDIFYQIFTAPFKSSNISYLFVSISIFAVAACSFIFAFKCGLFNIGISGQMLFGAMLCVILGQHMNNVPNGIGQILMILIGMVGGGIVGGLIGWLKITFNMNEVVSSIMFNWIVYFAGTYLVNSNCAIDPSGTYTAALPNNLLLQIDGQGAIPLVIITIFVIAISFVVFKFLVFGKKLTAVGMNFEGARYAGYNVKANRMSSMLISGLIAGVLGVMVYLGKAAGQVPTEIVAKTIPTEGFNGISVGLIAMCNPIGVIPVSILFGMVETAKSSIAEQCTVDSNITDLMFGIIVYGAAIVSLFYFVKPWKYFMRKYYLKHSLITYDEHEFNVESQIEEYSDAIHLINKKYFDHLFKIKKHNYYSNDILVKLEINNVRVTSWNKKKKLIDKINKFYAEHRLSKGEK